MATTTDGPSRGMVAGLVLSGVTVAQVWRVGLSWMEETSVPLSFGRDLGGDTSEFFPLQFGPFALGASVFLAGFGLVFLLVRAGTRGPGWGGGAGLAVVVVSGLGLLLGWAEVGYDGPRCGVRSYTQTTHCISESRTVLLDAVVPALPGLAGGILLLSASARARSDEEVDGSGGRRLSEPGSAESAR